MNTNTQGFDRLGEAWIHRGTTVRGGVRYKNLYRHTACGNLGKPSEMEGQLSIEDVLTA